MADKRKKEARSSLIEAARHAAGDAEQDEAPLTAKERRLMDEVRRDARRPSKKDIRNAVKNLLK